ncbi:MAG: thioesterase family protein [Gammaproteobacteria bacterium]|nr:thioesterase family protein [Gammaproteobacteria bacterium]NNC98499.1 thioesterase family protein [Gammaproteobacteria bacterium]NNM13480.1 thioesterase family protein [Gammaproteobacteria bacterium]
MYQLIRFWLKSIFIKDNISASAECCVSFRVKPWDCDPNWHMTNSRYFTYMDYARFWRYFHMGVFKDVFIKKKWMPMAVSQEITYIKDISPLEKFEVRSKLAGWDEKYVYMAQDFYGKKGLCAKAMIRGVFVHNKKPVSIEKVMQAFGSPPQVEAYRERITAWKRVLELKKAES